MGTALWKAGVTWTPLNTFWATLYRYGFDKGVRSDERVTQIQYAKMCNVFKCVSRVLDATQAYCFTHTFAPCNTVYQGILSRNARFELLSCLIKTDAFRFESYTIEQFAFQTLAHPYRLLTSYKSTLNTLIHFVSPFLSGRNTQQCNRWHNDVISLDAILHIGGDRILGAEWPGQNVHRGVPLAGTGRTTTGSDGNWHCDWEFQGGGEPTGLWFPVRFFYTQHT